MAVQLTHSGQELDNAIGKVLADYADVSGVTATASDVAAGKYFVDANKTLVEGTASAGGADTKIYTDTPQYLEEGV